MGKYYLGIDLGGTNIVAGVVDENYNIISTAKTSTNLPRTAQEIAEDMSKVALEAVKCANKSIDEIVWIGVGSPGSVDLENGIIEYANNLGFKNVPLRKYIQKFIKKPIYIENDANAAAYGEFIAGAAKGAKSSVTVTLGTGVGGGIVIDGKIYSGFNFAGGELGHMVIDTNGPTCTCGRKGCFEVFSSATGLIRMTKEEMEHDKNSILWEMSKNDGISGRLAFDAMKKGDKTAKAIVDKYIKYLSAGITNIINIFQPEVLCIGGGVSNAGDDLLLPVSELVAKEVYTRDSDKNTEIVIAKLGNDAGIIGAAFLGKAIK